MLTLISPAKGFVAAAKVRCPLTPTAPTFEREAAELIEASLRLGEDSFGHELGLSAKLRPELWSRQQQWSGRADEGTPALATYTGAVFRKLSAETLTVDQWQYAQQHLRLTSFAYGLLRPSDRIRPYRMEGGAHLGGIGVDRVFDYWRDKLTPALIEATERTGGVLVNLASAEMRDLFHWSEVEQRLRVITPQFLLRTEAGRLVQRVTYVKMARGEMVGALLRSQLSDPESLKALTPEGYVYDPAESEGDNWTFVREG